MKLKIRLISFVLILVLLPAMVVPAAADEVDNNFGWINLLDYSTLNTGSQFFTFSGSTVLNISVPNVYQLFSIDMLVNISTWNADIPTCTIAFGDRSVTLSPVKVGDDLYRYYGDLPAGNYSVLNMLFNGTSGSTYYCTMYTCNVGIVASSSADLNATVLVSATGHDDRYMDYVAGSSATVSIVDDMSDGTPSYYVLADHEDWKNYDYIDLLFVFYTGTVESVSAVYGETYLPTNVAYLNDPSVAVSSTYISVRIDLTGIDRSLSDYPLLTISGNLGFETNLFGLLSCRGHVVTNVNPLFYYFRSVTSAISSLGSTIGNYFSTHFGNLSSWISSQTSSLVSWLTNVRDSVVTWGTNIYNQIASWGSNIVSTISVWGQNIVSSINPDPDAGEEAKDQGAEKGQEIGNLNDQMNSMAKPDLSGSGDISGIISPGDLSNYTSFLTTILNAPYISQVVMLSLILSLAAYVLFGKR